MFARLFVIAILVGVPMAASAAPATPEFLPQTDRYVVAEFTLTQPNLTTVVLSGDLYVYRFDVDGKTYDADDLGQAFHGANKHADQPSGAEFLSQVEEDARARHIAILSSSFPGATISAPSADVAEDSLRVPSGSPFDPPVRIHVSATILRDRASVGLTSISDAGVAAALASGAQLPRQFMLTALQGYDITYAIRAPEEPTGLTFQPGPYVRNDLSALDARVDNIAGNTPGFLVLGTVEDASVEAPTSEDIRSAIDVTMGDIPRGAAGMPMDIHVKADIRALDVERRFPGLLPATVDLPYVNAEGVRALRQTGVLSDAAIASANEALLASIRADIARAFGPGATVTGGLSQDDLAQPATRPYTSEPPLRFDSTASATYQAPGANGDDIDLALRIGGAANVQLNLFAANGLTTTYVVHPPSIGEFASAEGGDVSADGGSATFTVPAGTTSFPASLAIRGKGVPDITAEDATVNVTVDLQDLDVSIGKALGGDLGKLLTEITVTGNLRAIEVPADMRSSLPPNLHLDFLGSDALRLLVDRGKITDADLTKLEDKLLAQIEDKLGAALGGDVPVTGGLDRTTLDIRLVSDPLSTDEPVVFKATARVIKPLAGGAIEPAAAIALYSTSLPLTFPKIQGLDTAYTVILPKGLAVKDVSGTGGETTTSKAPDGRDQFTVTPTGESAPAQMTVNMAVTPTFVMVKFWPIVLIAVILVVLVVGAPIALVMRSKKRKSAPKK